MDSTGHTLLSSRPVYVTALLVLGTVALGLAGRFAQLGLPPFVVKYSGSCFWALMVYWVVTTLRPHWGVLRALIVSGLIATAVEYFKLYKSPGVDAFRSTLPGILLLGKYFSVWDIVAYWLAILFGALTDRTLLRRPRT